MVALGGDKGSWRGCGDTDMEKMRQTREDSGGARARGERGDTDTAIWNGEEEAGELGERADSRTLGNYRTTRSSTPRAPPSPERPFP